MNATEDDPSTFIAANARDMKRWNLPIVPLLFFFVLSCPFGSLSSGDLRSRAVFVGAEEPLRVPLVAYQASSIGCYSGLPWGPEGGSVNTYGQLGRLLDSAEPVFIEPFRWGGDVSLEETWGEFLAPFDGRSVNLVLDVEGQFDVDILCSGVKAAKRRFDVQIDRLQLRFSGLLGDREEFLRCISALDFECTELILESIPKGIDLASLSLSFAAGLSADHLIVWTDRNHRLGYSATGVARDKGRKFSAVTFADPALIRAFVRDGGRSITEIQSALVAGRISCPPLSLGAGELTALISSGGSLRLFGVRIRVSQLDEALELFGASMLLLGCEVLPN